MESESSVMARLLRCLLEDMNRDIPGAAAADEAHDDDDHVSVDLRDEIPVRCVSTLWVVIHKIQAKHIHFHISPRCRSPGTASPGSVAGDAGADAVDDDHVSVDLRDDILHSPVWYAETVVTGTHTHTHTHPLRSDTSSDRDILPPRTEAEPEIKEEEDRPIDDCRVDPPPVRCVDGPGYGASISQISPPCRPHLPGDEGDPSAILLRAARVGWRKALDQNRGLLKGSPLTSCWIQLVVPASG